MQKWGKNESGENGAKLSLCNTLILDELFGGPIFFGHQRPSRGGPRTGLA